MRLLILLSIFLQLTESVNVTVLLFGSRYKTTKQRIAEKKKRILADAEKTKLLFSVYDGLNDFASESDLQGMWTIIPAIMKLKEVSDWTIVAEDTSEIEINNLEKFIQARSPSDLIFNGLGLQDTSPTIIHHFGMNAPESFLYPLLSAGFILSKSVTDLIKNMKKTERWSSFAIDAKYEFALLLHKLNSINLEHSPTLFCCGDFYDSCIVRCSASYPLLPSHVLEDSDIHVMIKTYSGHHHTRLLVLQNTWTRDLNRVEYCSDRDDPTIPTIDLKVGNTERGHCAKTWAIFRRFLDISGTAAKWLVVADDDTLMSWRRLKQLLEMHDSDDKIIIGERYGFGFSFDGETGYDYPTGGAGMVFSRSAVESLLKACPSCAAQTDPDDMTIGICAATSGIPIIHEPRLHQARPQDYAKQYLSDSISFHKFTDIDPISTYNMYLLDVHGYIPDVNRSEL